MFNDSLQTRLRMDYNTTNKQRQARVMELLKDLGLLKVQNTRIGIPGSDKSLSGGERKRLAFATEVCVQRLALGCH